MISGIGLSYTTPKLLGAQHCPSERWCSCAPIPVQLRSLYTQHQQRYAHLGLSGSPSLAEGKILLVMLDFAPSTNSNADKIIVTEYE